MDPRETILNSIRKPRLPDVELPPLSGDWTTFADPRSVFAELMQSVGGNCISVAATADVARCIKSDERFSDCRSVVSQIQGIESTVQLDQVATPHDLDGLDLAVLPGQFGVAENAAVWVTNKSLAHRAVLYIVEHLVLVVPSNRIINNMHEAYQGLTLGEKQFGCFISGPSKTADIEQALVIGAQGPRAHTVFLVDSQ